MLATFNEKEEEIPNGAIFVKGNIIEWVGSTADLPEKYSTADEVMSMKNQLIMPGMVGFGSNPLNASIADCETIVVTTLSTAAYGLTPVLLHQVNTHHHMFQCLTRCVAQDSYLFGWLSTCYSAWEQMKVSLALHHPYCLV